jgi:hypothetical protein
MQIVFDWIEKETEHYGNRFLPLCPLVLCLGSKKLPVTFKVDSGAIVTAINYASLQLLGVTQEEFEQAERIDLKTASGHQIWGRKFKVTISFQGNELSVEVFVSEKNELNSALLGIIDVFDYFDVNLQARNKKTVFVHHPASDS